MSLQKLFLTSLFCFLGFFVMAQDEDLPEDWASDPLKKPEIWQALKKEPTNATLWKKYMDKDLNTLNDKELRQYSRWRQQLMIQRLAENEAIVGLVISDDLDNVFIDEAAYNEFDKLIKETVSASEPGITKADLAGVEAIILSERQDLNELKGNILENFVIIEDIYSDIFDEYKVEYTYYNEAHPDGTYSKTKWVEDHEAKLKKLRDDQIKKLQKRYKLDN